MRDGLSGSLAYVSPVKLGDIMESQHRRYIQALTKGENIILILNWCHMGH